MINVITVIPGLYYRKLNYSLYSKLLYIQNIL